MTIYITCIKLSTSCLSAALINSISH